MTFFHPGGGLLWHWVRSVQHRGVKQTQQVCLLVVLQVTTLCFTLPETEPFHRGVYQHCWYDVNLSEYLTGALGPCAQQHNETIACLSPNTTVGLQEKECCDFHHLSHALRCRTSRIQNIPKQGDRAQKYHIARSCQFAGLKIEVLPEVLIQTSLSDMSVFLSVPGDYTLATSQWSVEERVLNLILRKEHDAPGRFRDLPKWECQPTKLLTPHYVAALQLSLFGLILKI